MKDRPCQKHPAPAAAATTAAASPPPRTSPPAPPPMRSPPPASAASCRTCWLPPWRPWPRSEEHTSELQSPCNLVCRLLLEKKNSCTDSTRRATRCRLRSFVGLASLLEYSIQQSIRLSTISSWP